MRIILPTNLFDSINEVCASDEHREKSYLLCDIILRNRAVTRTMYVDLPSAYLTKIFNKNYCRFFDKLRLADIVQSFTNCEGVESYSTVKRESKKYRINPMLMTSEIKQVELKTKETKKSVEEFAIACMSSLVYDLDSLNGITRAVCDSIRMTVITEPSDEKIRLCYPEFEACGMTDYGKKTYSTVAEELYLISDTRFSLCKIGRKYYTVGEPGLLLSARRTETFSSMDDSILRLHYGSFRANVNETNGRLDTNFTSLHGKLVESIMERNGLVQLDIANSQFAFLSSILGNSDDEITFKNMSAEGTLYEYLEEELGLRGRSDAKDIMFKLMFSKNSSFKSEKEAFGGLFPSVLRFVSKFKKSAKYADFSVMLQRMESDVMIGKIYSELAESGIWGLTVHDSVICKKDDSEKVRMIMERVLAESGIICKLNLK